MEHGIINGFSNRDKLIERLVDSYNNKTAPEIILLTGPAGSGKSFVANNVVKKCEKISRMRSYINRGDSFVSRSAVGNMPKLRVDNLSLSASFLYMSAGLEVGAHREESQYNHLKALLRSFQNHRFLFCLDGLSSAHSQVKSMAQLLLSHREDLERALSSK
uniref:ATP-binding protein n=2 Tax=Gemmiger formicilis TaxID=745368 RepID=UPI003FED9AAF